MTTNVKQAENKKEEVKNKISDLANEKTKLQQEDKNQMPNNVEADIKRLTQSFAPIKTAEDRIEKATHFRALSERYKMLKEKENDLKLFKAGNSKINAKITFTNEQGFNFEIKNNLVIDKLVITAQSELNVLLTETYEEVLNFEI
jgi:hypothetical protein